MAEYLQQFQSSEGASYEEETGIVEVILDTDVPRLILRTTYGQPCVLIGGDIGKFVAWLKEPGYKL